MKKLLTIVLITMFIASTSFFAIAADEVLCSCGCGFTVEKCPC